MFSDEEDDDDQEEDLVDFGPIRTRGVPLKQTTRPLGPPITADDEMEDLSEVHLIILEEFVHTAKDKLGQIVIAKSLRRQPVSDTVLRSIATHFPQTKEDMLEIEGIDEDKYDLYGSLLLKLSKQAYARYREMMGSEDQSDGPEPPDSAGHFR